MAVKVTKRDRERTNNFFIRTSNFYGNSKNVTFNLHKILLSPNFDLKIPKYFKFFEKYLIFTAVLSIKKPVGFWPTGKVNELVLT
jgi:hypothetical protein